MTFCDSVAMCMKKTAATCLPSINETGTTWQDVVLRGLLYAFILCLAYWAITEFFKWLNQQSEMKAKALQDKINSKRKQQTDLQDKLLNYYKDRLIKDKKDDKGSVITYDEDNCQKYVEQLTKMIDDLK